MFDDLTHPVSAYAVGLLQTDGCHSGRVDKKGRVSLELAEQDSSVLESLSNALGCYSSIRRRVRTTNFKSDYVTSTLWFYDMETRQAMSRAGVPTGRKSRVVSPPELAFSAPDYLRGLLDGDGSIGFTARGMPFISFVTASPALAQYFCDTVLEVCGVRRTANPNKRDGVYNLMVNNLAAAELTRWAWYSPDVIGIGRKKASAAAVADWVVPAHKAGLYGVQRKAWTASEDALILTLSPEEAAPRLGRTVQSVKMRQWRLANSP